MTAGSLVSRAIKASNISAVVASAVLVVDIMQPSQMQHMSPVLTGR